MRDLLQLWANNEHSNNPMKCKLSQVERLSILEYTTHSLYYGHYRINCCSRNLHFNIDRRDNKLNTKTNKMHTKIEIRSSSMTVVVIFACLFGWLLPSSCQFLVRGLFFALKSWRNWFYFGLIIWILVCCQHALHGNVGICNGFSSDRNTFLLFRCQKKRTISPKTTKNLQLLMQFFLKTCWRDHWHST